MKHANAALNALLAWLLAILLTGAPNLALSYFVVELIAGPEAGLLARDGWLLAWTLPGLVLTALLVRPVENRVRRWGYSLPEAGAAHGMDANSDTIGDAAREALEARLADELRRKD